MLAAAPTKPLHGRHGDLGDGHPPDREASQGRRLHRFAAETVTDIIAETRASDLADVATKADITALRTEIKADLSALETRIMKWLVPLLIGQTGLIVALIKLLP